MIVYRLLLLLYPKAFRRRYGPEMCEDFRRLLERTRQEGVTLDEVRLWTRTAADALVSGMWQRLFGPTPDGMEETKMRRMWFHLAQALGSLRRAPGYAAAFVVTLGLAIGVNSAVFSVVNGVLLQPLPFEGGDRILYLKQPVAAAGVDNTLFSFIEVDDYRAGSETIDEFVEFGEWEFTVLDDGEPHRTLSGLVTSNFFQVLGMRPAVGRLLNEQDDVQGAEPVMLLTDAYWDRAFGRDPAVVGRVLELENLFGGFVPTRVVGVLEPGHHYTGSRQPDFYANYAANPHYQGAAMRDSRGHRMTDLFARMAPGVTVAQARSELTSIADRLHSEHPDAYDPAMRFGLEVVRWQDELTRRGRSTFLILMGAVGLILLLAAANVGNLTLTRLLSKEDELSTRAALGASGTDLRLHITAEHAVLGLAGALLGILLALLSRDTLVAYAGRYTVRAQEVAVDWTVLGATLAGGVILAVVLAWLPGLPVNPGVGRMASARSRVTDGRGRKRIQRGLVVTQLALSFTLLTGAVLLVRSLVELSAVDPGFRTEQVLTARAPTGPYGDGVPGQPEPDWDRALDEIRGFAGVQSAAIATWTPLSAPRPTAVSVRLDDQEDAGDRSHLTASNNVSPEYFETLGIPLISGRYFTDDDRPGATGVVILNESMARAHFGDEDPVGRRISLASDVYYLRGASDVEPPWYEIVGVVADAREHGLNDEAITHTYYRPAAQTLGGPTVLVAYRGDAGPLTQHVREVIRGIQPDRAVEEFQTMRTLVEQDVAPSRLNAVLFGSFAVLALVIAALGVLAILAFSVSRRVREFGVRMALGADRTRLLWVVLREGAILVAVALAVGGAGAILLRRFMTGLLYGVQPVDPVSWALAGALLGTVAMAASLVPGLRATRIQPTEALAGE